MRKSRVVSALAAIGIAMPVAQALAADTITVASWGGTYQEAQGKAFFKPTI